MREHTIKNVYPESIAWNIGLVPGDKIVKINNKYINDILDYYYLVNDDYLEIMITKQSENENWFVELEKEYDELLGVEFEQPILSELKSCKNNCIFCFVNQMPKGMRESLYFKDDDYRLSVLSGNYITLTNLHEEELTRIINYRISPLYISVHTTDPDLRKEMMNNENAGVINKQLRLLKEKGIEMYGQIVLCPGINDAAKLEETLFDLYNLWPEFNNVAVVPVGLTSYRNELSNIAPVDKKKARELISQVNIFQNECLKRINSRFAFLADEFYLLADLDVPPKTHYEDFSQLENGVGLIRKFEKEIESAIVEIKSEKDNKNAVNELKSKYKSLIKAREVSLVTGVSSKNIIEKTVNDISKYFGGINLNVHVINNDFFGEHVTVSGLITGQDIINQLKDSFVGDLLLIPEVMLKNNEDVFLDGLNFKDLESSLKVKIIKAPVHGVEFVRLLSNLTN